ncbi:MAG: site-2 protease family protein [Opitutae bacterium]|nr:site-2 protease family protein [Opitutae bacterium]
MHLDLVSGLLWYVVFLFSTVCHEAAHAWSALKLGDDTAARGGQVSLSPWPHVRREPFGMVVVPLLSWFAGGWLLGWASAPYDPQWARQHPRHAALMALAGPAANLALVLACGLLLRLGYEWHVFAPPLKVAAARLAVGVDAGWPELAAQFLSIGVSLNLLLFLFNLVPLPPLDGSSLPLLWLSPASAERYQNALRSPAFAMLGIFLASRLVSPILPKLLLGATSVLYPSIRFH